MKKMLAVALIILVGIFMFTVPSVIAGPLEGLPCNGNTDGDVDVDGEDLTEFLVHFGRNQYNDPCPPDTTSCDPPAPVPQTGQTTSRATGDDGDLEKGVVWSNPRFTYNGDGTVTDNLTGLIWLKNAFCCGMRTWNNALSDSNGLASGMCGPTDGSSAGDWRLPNRRELYSLVHDEYVAPPLPNTAGTSHWLDGDPFTNMMTNYYWSSTNHASITTHAWIVAMWAGNVESYSKNNLNAVWPVRDPL